MSKNKIAPLRGMRDLLPHDLRVQQYIERIAKNISELYGYEGFSPPVLENSRIFNRTLGDTSDIVSKEIYSFTDKKGRIIALRPEFTAGIVRAFISNPKFNQELPLRLFSSGPIFRYDRPQEGRQRQFHQLNFEYIGAVGPYSDAETISMAARLIQELGLTENVILEINSLGCTESRMKYELALTEYFHQYEEELSIDSKYRLKKNPLRILDSKNEIDKKIVKDAPLISMYYTKDASQYFENVMAYLHTLNIQYTINPRLARGLDYYCHTTFEFTTNNLGAQGTVLAGGRYDGLTQLMGHKEKIPSIGFAAGVERIALIGNFQPVKSRPTIIIPIGNECLTECIHLVEQLRQNDIISILFSTGKVNQRIQKALHQNAKYIVFFGSTEQKTQICKLKDLDSNLEREVSIHQLSDVILQNKS